MSDLMQLAGDHGTAGLIAFMVVAWVTREVLPVYYKAKEKAAQEAAQPAAAPPVADIPDPLSDTGKHAAIVIKDDATREDYEEILDHVRSQMNASPMTQADGAVLTKTISGVTKSVKTLSVKVTDLSATVNNFHEALDEHKSDDTAHTPATTRLEN